MSNNNNNASSGRIGFVGLLTLVFITLKLCNVIAWSWVWVLSPFWITFGIAFIYLLMLSFTIPGFWSGKNRRR